MIFICLLSKPVKLILQVDKDKTKQMSKSNKAKTSNHISYIKIKTNFCTRVLV